VGSIEHSIEFGSVFALNHVRQKGKEHWVGTVNLIFLCLKHKR